MSAEKISNEFFNLINETSEKYRNAIEKNFPNESKKNKEIAYKYLLNKFLFKAKKMICLDFCKENIK